MMVSLNNVWGVALRGGSFILQKNGRDVRSYGSARELWREERHLFGKVDDGAFAAVLTLRAATEETLDKPKLGYWLHPEQLPNGKERQELGNEHI